MGWNMEGVQHNLGMAMVGTLECYEREMSVEVRGGGG